MRVIVDKLLLSLIVVVAMVLLACIGIGQSGRNQNERKPPDQVPAALATEAAFPRAQSVPKSALDREAEQAAEAFLKRAYYKCGDSYFTYVVGKDSIYGDNPVYTQIKGFAWKVKGSEVIYPPLTEADRLNGVKRPVGEWEGEIVVTFPAFRLHSHRPVDNALDKPDAWTEWRDPNGLQTHRSPYDSFPLAKKNGKWIVGATEYTQYGYKPVDCAAIPQASPKVSQVPDSKPPQIKNPAKPVRATVVADPMLVPPNALPKKSP